MRHAFWISLLKFTSVLLLFPTVYLVGQRSDVHKLILNDLYPGEGVETFDLRERKVITEYYFRDEWLYGVFLFEEDRESETEYTLKYDLLNHELVVRIENGAFIVPMNMIRGFILRDRNPGSVNEYVFKYHDLDVKNPGAEIALHLEEGHYTLVKYFYTEQLPATYVPALDAGSLNRKVVMKEKYFLIEDGLVTEVPKSRNKARKLFEQQYDDAQAFIRETAVDLKEEDDLISLVEFLNQSYLKKSKT